MIAEAPLPGFELTVIGRCPEGPVWREPTTQPPEPQKSLGEELRRHYLYLAAAMSEGEGWHHIEGTQCGLPLVYHEDGGHRGDRATVRCCLL